MAEQKYFRPRRTGSLPRMDHPGRITYQKNQLADKEAMKAIEEDYSDDASPEFIAEILNGDTENQGDFIINEQGGIVATEQIPATHPVVVFESGTQTSAELEKHPGCVGVFLQHITGIFGRNFNT